jgi:hypothetical protein
MPARLTFKAETDKFGKGTPTDTIRNPRPDEFIRQALRLDDAQDRSSKPSLIDWAGAFPDSAPAFQTGLFHRRVSTRLPDAVQGRHLAFTCFTDDGSYFFCKEDRDGHPARATDWFATRLARHLGIPTAECAIIEDSETGEEFFGSRRLPSVADRFAVAEFLARPRNNELGGPGTWPGQFLAMLRAYDLFIDNPDRGPENFVLSRDGSHTNLCPIDYASARLFRCSTDHFPLDHERTIFVGKAHELIHGPHRESAVEMLNRLAGVPAGIINGILGEMPETWLTDQQRGTFSEFWSAGPKDQRLQNLRTVLSG